MLIDEIINDLKSKGIPVGVSEYTDNRKLRGYYRTYNFRREQVLKKQSKNKGVTA